MRDIAESTLDLGPDGVLKMTREYETVYSSSPQPDSKWQFTDAAGHEHYRGDHSYPTLKTVVDRTYWCEGCRDKHTETHLACKLCDESIEPSTVPPNPSGYQFITAEIYTLNDEPITRDQFNDIVTEQRTRFQQEQATKRAAQVRALGKLLEDTEGLTTEERARRILDEKGL